MKKSDLKGFSYADGMALIFILLVAGPIIGFLLGGFAIGPLVVYLFDIPSFEGLSGYCVFYLIMPICIIVSSVGLCYVHYRKIVERNHALRDR